jgi:riboflavin synthase alpha subunit
MFTGIVEELGTVVSREGSRLRIAAKTVLDDVELGASIAVNGTCLTVVGWDDADGWWEADVVDESYARTSLGALEPGHPVNLERPVRLSDRLGGHLVQGHVDGVGEIGDNVVIKNSYVGPYTALGDNVIIEGSEIEASIVMKNCVIRNMPGRIDSSLLADNSQVTSAQHVPDAHRLILAENSYVQL